MNSLTTTNHTKNLNPVRKSASKTKTKPLSEAGINPRFTTSSRSYGSAYTSPLTKATKPLRNERKKGSLNFDSDKKAADLRYKQKANNNNDPPAELTDANVKDEEHLSINKIPNSPISMRKGINAPIRFSRDTVTDVRVHTDVSRFDPISPTSGMINTVNTEMYDINDYCIKGIDKNTSSDTIVADFNRGSRNGSY